MHIYVINHMLQNVRAALGMQTNHTIYLGPLEICELIMFVSSLSVLAHVVWDNNMTWPTSLP